MALQYRGSKESCVEFPADKSHVKLKMSMCTLENYQVYILAHHYHPPHHHRSRRPRPSLPPHYHLVGF
jgi:hypothetical protein